MSQIQITIPTIEKGQEVYDAIMAEIEPDLTSEGVKLLDEKYKNETPEQTRARARRYDAAMVKYQKKYDEYLAVKNVEVTHFVHKTIEAAEAIDRRSEMPRFYQIENSILQNAA